MSEGMNEGMSPDLWERLQEATGREESGYTGLTPEQERKIREWEERASHQEESFASMKPGEREAYGVKLTESLEEKQRRDEEEHPSKKYPSK